MRVSRIESGMMLSVASLYARWIHSREQHLLAVAAKVTTSPFVVAIDTMNGPTISSGRSPVLNWPVSAGQPLCQNN